MKQDIINILQQKSTPSSITEITSKLKIINHLQQEEMMKTLILLKDSKIIFQNKEGNYYFNKQFNNKLIIGKIQITSKGIGFVKSFSSDLEYRVEVENVNGALNGDEVVFSLLNNKSNQAVVNAVLQRKTNIIVGVISIVNGKKTISIHNSKLQNYQVRIKNENKAIENNIVTAKINSFKDGVFDVTIEKILGNLNDPGVDILSVIYEFNIKPQFDHETLLQASKVPMQVLESEKQGRVDLRNEILITIDGKDAKDFDDAICVYKLKNGNYRLIVAIADVSHYVKENTPLDDEAFKRGTSVYLADRVVPMLPTELSNGICSLNEQVERLCMVCDMEIDSKGNNVSHKIYQGLMKSVRRMNYDEVNEAFDGKEVEFIKTHKQVWDMLQDAKELFFILSKYKENAGVVDFKIKEAKLLINEQGKVFDINLRNDGLTENLIESFMIRANEVTAYSIEKRDLPFIYRVHNQPRVQKLQQITTILKLMGVKINKDWHLTTSKDLQELLDSLKGLPSFQIISSLLLRSMEKAVYSNNNIGHFGLASDCYTHFTSPIRRYPDLIVHRLLKEYATNQKLDAKIIEKNKNFTALAAQQSTDQEIKAMECERAVDQMKKAEYMNQFSGKKFSAIISGITSFGVFVQLDNTVEGMIKISDINDDYYIFNEKNMTIYGKYNRRQYSLGQKVNVILKSANKITRTIDFVFDLPTKNNFKINKGKIKKQNNSNKSKIKNSKKDFYAKKKKTF